MRIWGFRQKVSSAERQVATAYFRSICDLIYRLKKDYKQNEEFYNRVIRAIIHVGYSFTSTEIQQLEESANRAKRSAKLASYIINKHNTIAEDIKIPKIARRTHKAWSEAFMKYFILTEHCWKQANLLCRHNRITFEMLLESLPVDKSDFDNAFSNAFNKVKKLARLIEISDQEFDSRLSQ